MRCPAVITSQNRAPFPALCFFAFFGIFTEPI